MRLIFKAEDYLVRAEKALLSALIFVMVVLSFLQVVLRLFFASGILWADPLLRHFVLWAGFLGAALAARYHAHFSLDIAARFLPEKLKKSSELLNRVFACAVCAALLFAAVKFLRQEAAGGVVLFNIGAQEIPALWLEFMLPAGFALMFLHTALGIFRKEQ